MHGKKVGSSATSANEEIVHFPLSPFPFSCAVVLLFHFISRAGQGLFHPVAVGQGVWSTR